MKRDLMLMEAILGHLYKSSEAWLGANAIALGLNVDKQMVRHHLDLLQDKGILQSGDGNLWRLTNQGHDYLEGTPEQGISLKSLGG
jgi:predicted ArsR family transcriptional regulator